jgi:hypothetical protein
MPPELSKIGVESDGGQKFEVSEFQYLSRAGIFFVV